MTASERALSASGSLAIQTTFLQRVGLAVVRPQWALAIAGGRRHPGRSGSDLLAMIVLVLAATQLGSLVGAIWLGAAVNWGIGGSAVVQIMTNSLTNKLAFLVIGALILWLAAGKRRDLGRAFDLACVATLPLLVVDLVATTLLRALDLQFPIAVSWGLTGMAFAWAGALIALASRIARVAPSATPAPASEGIALGRKAGWGVVALLGLGLAMSGLWIARNLDLIRPVTGGMPAPEIALPVIADGSGTHGPIRSLADSRGKILVIDFWATWCKPCLAALPQLEAVARAPDVEVIAINLDEPGRAWSMFQTAGYREMMLLEDDGKASRRYGVSKIPHTVIVDRDGMVRTVFRSGGHDIAAAIEKIRK